MISEDVKGSGRAAVAAMLVAAAASLSSCYTNDGNLLGQVQVGWAFPIPDNCLTTNVTNVQVTLFDPNMGIVAQMVYSCSLGEATLGNVPPGQYVIQVDGLQALSSIYRASVNGWVGPGLNVFGTLILLPTTGVASLSWTFDGSDDCMTAGVTNVQITITTGTGGVLLNETRPCDDHQASISRLSPGERRLQLFGLDVTGGRLFEASREIRIVAGPNDLGSIDMIQSTTTGNLSFGWAFLGQPDCASAGVEYVNIRLLSTGGQLVFSSIMECPAMGYTITGLAPGYYDLALVGLDGQYGKIWIAGPSRIDVNTGKNDLGTIILSKV